MATSTKARLRAFLDRFDPAPRIVRLRTRRVHVRDGVSVVGVYRRRNAETMGEVLAPADAAGARIRLWALDTCAPELERWTIGTGLGGRFELLNRTIDMDDEGYLVVVDDDVDLVRGGIIDLVRVAHSCAFDLAQPAHAIGSVHKHGITSVRPMSMARRTTFVEIGPIFVASPRVRPNILPFPERTPMGWGVNVDWLDLLAMGRRFGIVDAVRMLHRGPVGAGYGDGGLLEERQDLDRALAKRGAGDVRALQRNLELKRPWAALGP